MPKINYLFYDIETTGLSCCFDQIVDFAAIITDANLREISRHEYTIKLRPEVIPSPEAMITHRIPLAHIQQGMGEYEAIKEIHALFNRDNTLSIGYNSLGFDDEFMRFCFYRNLLPPYTHQYANGCGRLDLYPITLLYYLFHQDVDIIWPTKDGKPTLKLEEFNNANKWVTGQSHTAIVDVEVTIALAKKLQSKKQIWHYALGYFNKQESLTRLQKLPTYNIANRDRPLALLINGRFGLKNNYQVPALYLGIHTKFKNQQVWLRLDDPELPQKAQSTPDKCFCVNKKITEPPLFLPLVEKYCQHIIPERQQLIDDNLQFLQDNARLLSEIAAIHLNFTYPEVEYLDLDAALYTQNFPTPQEQREQQQFHKWNWEEKKLRLDNFSNPAHKELAARLIARNTGDYSNSFQAMLSEIYTASETKSHFDYKNQAHKNIPSTLARIAELKQSSELDSEQLQQLEDLQVYLESL